MTTATDFQTACNQALRQALLNTLTSCVSINLEGAGDQQDRFTSNVEVDYPGKAGWRQEVVMYIDDTVEPPSSAPSTVPTLEDTAAMLAEQVSQEDTTTAVMLHADVYVCAKRQEGTVTFGLALFITVGLRHS